MSSTVLQHDRSLLSRDVCGPRRFAPGAMPGAMIRPAVAPRRSVGAHRPATGTFDVIDRRLADRLIE